MTTAKLKLLIVDDEDFLRTSLAAILSRAGYAVRLATDGFCALEEIRRDCPDLIVCDLNMPYMSGFELLSVVRRRWPSIRVMAMSGAFLGVNVPQGVAADAYYAKGTNLTSLLERLDQLWKASSIDRDNDAAVAPLWISVSSNSLDEVLSVTLCCPECLRTFASTLGLSAELVRRASCAHCSTSVHYAIVEPLLPPASLLLSQRPGATRV